MDKPEKHATNALTKVITNCGGIDEVVNQPDYEQNIKAAVYNNYHFRKNIFTIVKTTWV